MRRIFWLSVLTLTLIPFATYSDSSFTKREDVHRFINKMVKNHRFDPIELTTTLSKVKLQPQIIQSMEQPYEKKNWDVYRAIFLTPQQLRGGLDFWASNQKILKHAQRQYGVPPEIIIAILGVETRYGEKQGNNKILDALATLAFEYPKRSTYFVQELEQYLLLCRELKCSPSSHNGSYAGAIGKPQFMPSSYRKYAVDHDKKGYSDLINNNADAIMSIANYFYHHGWKPYEGISQPVKLSSETHKKLLLNPRYANYTYKQLLASGVKPVTAAHNHPRRAGLFEFTKATGNEYWIGYPNFFVIMRYNSSPQYALAVYLLSQQLKQEWLRTHATKHRAYA